MYKNIFYFKANVIEDTHQIANSVYVVNEFWVWEGGTISFTLDVSISFNLTQLVSQSR